ncbi:unnamed protein product [Adineta ricciae]|uniref:Uncharacterized protein n=1 Tax=Adineta ricciae TaxID=249248 RepID=A0A815UC91_ADIRI|nr:unnamed protein product [Adineta ricciae]
MSREYIFMSDSTIDTYGYFYNNSFDPSRPSQNLITSNDDGGTNRRFQLYTTLQSQYTYILVVTTTNRDIRGSFQIIASDHQLCGSCETPYSPDDKSSTKAIVAIVVPICSVCVRIVICCCICRCRRKNMSHQQLTSLEHNQIIRRRRSSLGNIQITATITNAIDVPFTVPLARVFESLEEEQPPPPPYTSVIPYSRA